MGNLSSAWSNAFSMPSAAPSPTCALSTKSLPPGLSTRANSLAALRLASLGISWKRYTLVTASKEPSSKGIASQFASASRRFPAVGYFCRSVNRSFVLRTASR